MMMTSAMRSPDTGTGTGTGTGTSTSTSTGTGTGTSGSTSGIAWHAYVLLLRPRRILAKLEKVRASGMPVSPLPNLWQLELGVLRMWHRILFRSETVGTSPAGRVRPTLRARLLHWRPLRFPFLVAERAVAPLDSTGMVSSRERVIRHLLGAHHDGNQFVFDLELLHSEPGALEELARRVAALNGPHATTRRAQWLRDLTVFEGYHESLERAVQDTLAHGLPLSPAEAANADISFRGYLAWCARQPATPAATLAAWRRGSFSFAPEASP